MTTSNLQLDYFISLLACGNVNQITFITKYVRADGNAVNIGRGNKTYNVWRSNIIKLTHSGLAHGVQNL